MTAAQVRKASLSFDATEDDRDREEERERVGSTDGVKEEDEADRCRSSVGGLLKASFIPLDERRAVV